MKKITNKTQLLDAILSSRRQLDRYLFEFEKDASGEFVPSQRSKFSEAEANAPGVLGSWSLYQVLAGVRSVEQAFLYARRSSLLGPGGVSMVSLADTAGFMGGLVGSPNAQPLPVFFEQYRASHQEFLAYLRGLPEEALFTPQPLPLVDELLEATCRSYDRAKENIRHWLKAQEGRKDSKAALLKRIETERCRLVNTLARLSPDQMVQPGVIGAWSVKDTLAHLAAWEQLFVGWYQAGLRGETAELLAPGFSWREIDKINEQIYKQHKDRDLADVQAWFAESYGQMLFFVKMIPEEDLFVPGRYAWQGKHTLETYVVANSANHYYWANSKIRKFYPA